MRPSVAIASLLVLFVGATIRPAGAAVVALDATPVFNADVVVNDGTGTLDATQEPIDLGVGATGNFCFPTATAALRFSAFSPDGLPDDAFFPADAFHPDVTLAWRNADDGWNARRAPSTDVFTLPVPAGSYSEVHVFLTSGDGSSDAIVTLAYSDLPVASTAVFVPDWFDDPVPTADAYLLVDGRDRVQPGSGPGTPFLYEESNDPAIFGFRVRADPAGTLTDLRIERTDATGALNFFGAVAVEAVVGPGPPDLYESPQAPGLLAPGNVVATGVASPFDWSPPPGSLLHYFVDDGTGTPAIIYVAKGPRGLVFTF